MLLCFCLMYNVRMKTKTSFIMILFLILLSFLVGAYFYPQLPEQMVTHWGSGGEPNGYMSKFWGVFFLPVILLGMSLLFLYLPKIDPLKKDFVGFKKYYNAFIVITIAFLFYVYLLSIVWNLNFVFNMTQFVIPAVGALFFYLGTVLGHVQRNWFIGIRTPWTLSSDSVWDKTHKLGSKLFKIAGLLIVVGIFFEKYLIWFILVPTILITLILFVYSYLVYREEKNNKN